jgi:hypothetical protein
MLTTQESPFKRESDKEIDRGTANHFGDRLSYPLLRSSVSFRRMGGG